VVTDYVIHRVQAIYGDDKILTAGDNEDDGEYIRSCQIKGVVIGVLLT
jgi:hypothetical protein